MKGFTRVFTTLLALYLIAAPEISEARLPRLRDEIAQKIDATEDLRFRTLDIRVAPGGHVTLEGTVKDKQTKDKIEVVVRSIPRVTGITNKIAVEQDE